METRSAAGGGRLLNAQKTTLVLYYVAFTFYVSVYILSYTTIQLGSAVTLVNGLCLLLLVLKFLTQHLNIKRLLFSAALVLIGFVSWRTTTDMNLLMLFAFVVCGEGVDAKALAKIVICVELIAIVFVSTLSVFGVIQSVTRIRQDGTIGTSLGFSHPNRLGSNVLALCCSYAVVRYPHFRFRDLFIYIAAALFVTVVTDSRTSTILIAIVPVVSWAFCFASKRRNVRPFIIALSIVLLALVSLSFFFMMNYDSADTSMVEFSNNMSGRPYFMNFYYKLYPPTLFGYNLNGMVRNAFGMEGVTIDNAYAKLLIVFGYIPSIVFYMLYIGIFARAFRRNQLDACMLGIFIYGCMGATEWQSMHFAMNYCLVGFSALLFAGSAQHPLSKRIESHGSH
jgi:hypothetical protein